MARRPTQGCIDNGRDVSGLVDHSGNAKTDAYKLESDYMTGQQSFLRRFTFSDTNSSDNISIYIPQVVDPQYGMYIWPSAPVLAQYIWFHRKQLRGKTVLELGSGTSLPGVLASKLGAEVTLTDASLHFKCLENCIKSGSANGVDNVRVCGLTWGQFTPDIIQMKPDYIIASDCFYDPKDFENIILTVSYLLSKCQDSQFWTTYQVRSSNWTIETLLQKWKLKGRRVLLGSFGANSPSLAGTELPGNHSIQMFVITRSTDESPNIRN